MARERATLKQRLRDWAIAAGCFVAAWAVRHLAGPSFESHYPFGTFLCAVAITAYLCGLWPALAVALLSSLVAYATYVRPLLTLSDVMSSRIGAGAFFLASALCALLIASLRGARDRLEVERKRYASLAESRDVLYRELQHRTSNNIQVVASLLLVQAATASPSGRKALTEAANRIALVAKIQHDLHRQARAPTPFRDFARDLLSNAVAAAGAEQVQVRIEGGETPLHPNQATPVSLVLLECVNNALEHAFAEARAGILHVALERSGERWRLIVRDNGPGPPQDLNIPDGSSLGLKIVRAMAMQLQGEFTITDGGPGAVCELTYPALP